MADLTEAEQAAQAVVDARKARDEARAAADAAQKAFQDAQDGYDAAVAAAEGPVNPHQDQIDRMAYIQAQAEQRAARFGVAFELRQDAPSPDALDPRSPLDKSMQRKTARGSSRPKIDPKG